MQKQLGMSIGVGLFIEYIICTRNRDGSDSKTNKKGIAQRGTISKKSMQTKNRSSNKGGQNNDGNGNGNDEDDDKIQRITNALQKYSQICEPLKICCD